MKGRGRAAILDSLLERDCEGRQAEEIFAEETKHQARFQTKTKPGFSMIPHSATTTHTHTHTSISPQFCSNDWCLCPTEMKV